MKSLSVESIIFLTLVLSVLIMLSGCAVAPAHDPGDGRILYDMYMDRPGYYDFGSPVIFVPE